MIAMQSLGRVVSPVFIGWAFDADYKFPFWIMGGLSVCMCIVAMTLIPMVPMEGGVDAVKREEAISQRAFVRLLEEAKENSRSEHIENYRLLCGSLNRNRLMSRTQVRVC